VTEIKDSHEEWRIERMAIVIVGVTNRTIWLWKVVQKIKVNKKAVKESVEAKNRIKRKKDSSDGQRETNRRKKPKKTGTKKVEKLTYTASTTYIPRPSQDQC